MNKKSCSSLLSLHCMFVLEVHTFIVLPAVITKVQVTYNCISTAIANFNKPKVPRFFTYSDPKFSCRHHPVSTLFSKTMITPASSHLGELVLTNPLTTLKFQIASIFIIKNSSFLYISTVTEEK